MQSTRQRRHAAFRLYLSIVVLIMLALVAYLTYSNMTGDIRTGWVGVVVPTFAVFMAYILGRLHELANPY